NACLFAVSLLSRLFQFGSKCLCTTACSHTIQQRRLHNTQTCHLDKLAFSHCFIISILSTATSQIRALSILYDKALSLLTLLACWYLYFGSNSLDNQND